jgi:hypothetical protein
MSKTQESFVNEVPGAKYLQVLIIWQAISFVETEVIQLIMIGKTIT